MFPGLNIGLSILGLGLSGAGSLFGASESKKQNQIQQAIYAQEQQANLVRQKAMQLSAHRQNIENIRNVQRQAALATATATNQGAQFGSGLAGGLGQIQAQGAWNAQGINQNLEMGEQMFSINNNISGLKQQLSQSQSNSATYAGLSSFGNSLFGSANTLGNIFNGFGSNNQSNMNWPYINNPSYGNTGGWY